jgi:quercetin dioxygenase-like cupin family protein
MPIEIRRFGVGHRRPEGPPGSVGLNGQVIHADGRGNISELAFGRNGRIEPHTSRNTTWLIVVEGGGWVAVGEEYTRIAAGEAALWPADIPHAAWTEHSQMRAFLVEFTGTDDRTLAGTASVSHADADLPIGRGVGQLAARTDVSPRGDPEAGEPT